MTKITSQDFSDIKKLIDNGVKPKDISKMSGRTLSTISLIKHSKSLDEYHFRIAGYRYVYKKKHLSLWDKVLVFFDIKSVNGKF